MQDMGNQNIEIRPHFEQNQRQFLVILRKKNTFLIFSYWNIHRCIK